MITLDTRPTCAYEVPNYHTAHIIVVGCGGTGSAVAPMLAQLLWHIRESGKGVTMTLIDGDTVEHKNIGRQKFSSAEIGHNKAHTLSQRISAWLGIRCASVPFYIPEGWEGVENYKGMRGTGKTLRIVVSCVDNALARNELTNMRDKFDVWIDAGNDYNSGTVFVGTGDRYQTNRLNKCTSIPWPTIQMPDLLRNRPKAEVQHDCALGMAAGDQSLAINEAMAVCVKQIVFGILADRKIKCSVVDVSLDPITFKSRLLHPAPRRVIFVADSAKHRPGTDNLPAARRYCTASLQAQMLRFALDSADVDEVYILNGETGLALPSDSVQPSVEPNVRRMRTDQRERWAMLLEERMRTLRLEKSSVTVLGNRKYVAAVSPVLDKLDCQIETPLTGLDAASQRDWIAQQVCH